MGCGVMYDVVIPVRPGERNDELRMVLRSLKNLPVGRVHLYGFAPSWVNRDTVRVVPRRLERTKHETVTAHTHAALTDPEVSQPFYLFNDDQYVTRPVDVLPVYHGGTVLEKVAEYRAAGRNGSYVKSMLDTLERLDQLGYVRESVLSYELHTPMLVYKKRMTVALQNAAGPRSNHRTMYGAIANLQRVATRHDDVKVYGPDDPIPAGPFLSTADTSFKYVREYLEGLFPDACDYER